jgi:hypothetical protein
VTTARWPAPTVVTDPRRSRRLFLTWVRSPYSGSDITGGDARFSRSVDGGTFSARVVIDTPPAGSLAGLTHLVRLADGQPAGRYGRAGGQPEDRADQGLRPPLPERRPRLVATGSPCCLFTRARVAFVGAVVIYGRWPSAIRHGTG